MYIAKPSRCGCGSGIKLITKLNDIPSFEMDKDYVIQEYINKPLLLNKKKFDFRIYVLVQSLDPFVVFIAKENMTRFCVEDYIDPNKSRDKNKIYSQLTNYSINKMHEDFKLDDQEDSHKKTMSEVFGMLDKKGCDIQKIWDDIKYMTSEVMNAWYPYLYHQWKLAFQNENPHHFQILGIDVILD